MHNWKYILIYITMMMLLFGCITEKNKTSSTKVMQKMFLDIGYEVDVYIDQRGTVINISNCLITNKSLVDATNEMIVVIVQIGAAFKLYNNVSDEFLILVRSNQYVLKTTASKCLILYKAFQDGVVTNEMIDDSFEVLEIKNKEVDVDYRKVGINLFNRTVCINNMREMA